MVLSFLNPDTLVIDSFSPKDSCYLLTCLVLHPESLVCQFGSGLGFPDSSVGKESACSAGDPGSIPGWEDPLEKEQATHSSILELPL